MLDSSNKVARYIAECKRLGLRLSVPDVNKSVKGFFADGNVINYGLLGIKNLGSEFINDIMQMPYVGGESTLTLSVDILARYGTYEGVYQAAGNHVISTG